MSYYVVEAEVLTVDPSITYLPSEMTGSEWTQICSIPMLETEQEELVEAREIAKLARKFYATVRIVEFGPSGVGSVVR